MSTEEDAYRAELAKNGVVIPEEKAEEEKAEDKTDADKSKADESKKVEEKAESKDEEESKDKEPLQNADEQKPKKRSIYDDLKDTRKDLKSEKQLREEAEKERDDYRTKFEALSTAKTPEEKQEAKNDLEEFAKEINADPTQLRKMRELFLKEFKIPELDPNLAKDLEEWKADKATREKASEKVRFEAEFGTILPTIKEMFPSISDAELGAVKRQVDIISHSEGWNDKDLDYILFKNKDKLTPLVSPRKRGMESKDRKDEGARGVEIDFSQGYPVNGSPSEKEAWEKAYKEAGKTDGLLTSGDGKKFL